MFQGCFKEVLGVFRETFKGDSRELQVCFKKISLNVSRMYQESLNEVSIAISLHESHRSYPSRRRACLRHIC